MPPGRQAIATGHGLKVALLAKLTVATHIAVYSRGASAETLTRLNGASQEQLETWADRSLDAHTLDEVFQDHQPLALAMYLTA